MKVINNTINNKTMPCVGEVWRGQPSQNYYLIIKDRNENKLEALYLSGPYEGTFNQSAKLDEMQLEFVSDKITFVIGEE